MQGKRREIFPLNQKWCIPKLFSAEMFIQPILPRARGGARLHAELCVGGREGEGAAKKKTKTKKKKSKIKTRSLPSSRHNQSNVDAAQSESCLPHVGSLERD